MHTCWFRPSMEGERTTVEGVHCCNGEPVHHSPFAATAGSANAQLSARLGRKPRCGKAEGASNVGRIGWRTGARERHWLSARLADWPEPLLVGGCGEAEQLRPWGAACARVVCGRMPLPGGGARPRRLSAIGGQRWLNWSWQTCHTQPAGRRGTAQLRRSGGTGCRVVGASWVPLSNGTAGVLLEAGLFGRGAAGDASACSVAPRRHTAQRRKSSGGGAEAGSGLDRDLDIEWNWNLSLLKLNGPTSCAGRTRCLLTKPGRGYLPDSRRTPTAGARLMALQIARLTPGSPSAELSDQQRKGTTSQDAPVELPGLDLRHGAAGRVNCCRAVTAARCQRSPLFPPAPAHLSGQLDSRHLRQAHGGACKVSMTCA